MDITEFQMWLDAYYQDRGWKDLNAFIRIGFLAEETGEVARAIRALEIGRDRADEAPKSEERLMAELTEELGDVLGNVLILASKYEITLEELLLAHQTKLEGRRST
ncbi:MazG-like family protein [uncultured Vagococcus sp.]|uniref:MazG-like family protein n=1 Tax=uncultured Vagococcus sp. TaxID=189676 RepID=UPI0028D78F8B|nr:MazG-like family protein [uncultured Vagococcus sp.]